MNARSARFNIAVVTSFLAAIAVLALAVFIGINAAWGIDDAYAQVRAVSMVRHYMEDHNGQWPNSWEDLRPYFESGGGEVGGWSFEEFQRRIYIDFDADTEALRPSALSTDSPEFDVIHARWTVIAFGDGPNVDLHYHFRRDAGIVEAFPPIGGWRSPEEQELTNELYRRGFFIGLDDENRIVEVYSTSTSDIHARDADAEELVKHQYVRRVNFVGGEITDNGLKAIATLPRMERLTLGEKITNDGLKHLIDHPHLNRIDLFGTQVTDDGLVYLYSIPNLKQVRLNEEQFSKEAIQELKSAIPGLKLVDPNILEVD